MSIIDTILGNTFEPDPDRPGYFITLSGMRGAPAEPIDEETNDE